MELLDETHQTINPQTAYRQYLLASDGMSAGAKVGSLEGFLETLRPRPDFGTARCEPSLDDLPNELLQIDPDNSLQSCALKRSLDLLGASTILILGLPVFVLIALLVKLSGPGPVFFRQRRLGVDGRQFWCYKFRSMVQDAEAVLRNDPQLKSQFDENFKLKHDPRITPIGNFLRKTSLDELPQFFNVLCGHMTLIGPRPIVPDEIVKYGKFDRKLLSVKPGLSGLWQALGRSDTSYPERVAMDMLYIDHQCMRLDLKLMMLTVVAVLRKKGAC